MQKYSFLRKGIAIAVLSGICYGLYTAFLTLGLSKGIWGSWHSYQSVFSGLAVAFVVAPLASALNDILSSAWSLVFAWSRGKLLDFCKICVSKIGLIIAGAAFVGGVISSASYVCAIHLAGSAVIPISALCPAFGALLSRVLYKQSLNLRIMFGILICISASFLIGFASLSSESAPPFFLVGCLLALGAALCWGIEGCVVGYSTAFVDSEISIAIRQLVSGWGNLLLLIPVLSYVSGMNVVVVYGKFCEACTDWSVVFFIISGFFAMYAYGLWCKGNSMCGTALGMACNGAYSFWGPFFCWLILGVFCHEDHWDLHPVSWLGALLMVVGIFFIALNPLRLFHHIRTAAPSHNDSEGKLYGGTTRAMHDSDIKRQLHRCEYRQSLKERWRISPLSFQILMYFTTHQQGTAQEVMAYIEPELASHRSFTLRYVQEVLRTAAVNGLLTQLPLRERDEMTAELYQATPEQRELIASYIA